MLSERVAFREDLPWECFARNTKTAQRSWLTESPRTLLVSGSGEPAVRAIFAKRTRIIRTYRKIRDRTQDKLGGSIAKTVRLRPQTAGDYSVAAWLRAAFSAAVR